MAFSYSDTSVTNTSAGCWCAVSASDVGASDLIVVDVHSQVGVIERWEVILESGTAATVDPTVYWAPDAAADKAVVDWTGAAAAVIQSEVSQHYRAPFRRLYVKTTVDAGTDNVVTVRLFLGDRA